MKAIKITTSNAEAIDAALFTVNGFATAHTYNIYKEIEHLANSAEKKLNDLWVAKKDRPGAVYYALSGSAVSNAYARKGRQRIATKVTLERRSSGWFLVDIKSDTIYQGGGFERITLTKAQAEIAHRAFGLQFGVAS